MKTRAIIHDLRLSLRLLAEVKRKKKDKVPQQIPFTDHQTMSSPGPRDFVKAESSSDFQYWLDQKIREGYNKYNDPDEVYDYVMESIPEGKLDEPFTPSPLEIQDMVDAADPNAEPTVPQAEDYVISDARHGGGVDVGIEDGKFFGTFPNEDAAYRAIYDQMNRDKFWPAVWFMSDHGNGSIDTGFLDYVKKHGKKRKAYDGDNLYDDIPNRDLTNPGEDMGYLNTRNQIDKFFMHPIVDEDDIEEDEFRTE